jgi:hypothetical protein
MCFGKRSLGNNRKDLFEERGSCYPVAERYLGPKWRFHSSRQRYDGRRRQQVGGTIIDHRLQYPGKERVAANPEFSPPSLDL